MFSEHSYSPKTVSETVPVKGVLEYFAAKYTYINRDRLRALLFYSELEYYKVTKTRLTDTDYNAAIEGFAGTSITTAFNDMQYEHDTRTIYNTKNNTIRFTNINSSDEMNALPTEHIENTPLYSLDYTDEPVNFSRL